MRKLALLLLIAEVAQSAFAARNVTIEQLEQVLDALRNKPDAKVAQQLSEFELTERLSTPRLASLEAALPGPESRRALVILADVSGFLNPPKTEIPATAIPDLMAQRQLMARTVDYASKTIHQLPNFFATRDTIRFEATPQGHQGGTSLIPPEPLHPVGRSTDTVLYRDGQEVASSVNAKNDRSESGVQGLITSGVFGPILGTVLVDAAHSKLIWSHWEQGASGVQAVFYYEVPREKSHYEVEFCCVLGNNGDRVFQQFSGYHGEIVVDPANGTILRLTLQADLKRSDPIAKSDILVEYGPVEIGGKTYICPVRSVSILRAPATPSNPENLLTLLNDVAFGQYHLFRADAHLMAGNNEESNGNKADIEFMDASHSGSPFAAENKKEVPIAQNRSSVASPESSVPPGPAAPATMPLPTPIPVTEAGIPEMTVGNEAGLQESFETPRLASEKSFTVRVTTRLVDVAVIALDKKGHPITDLKPEDFEIYDNGRKQEVRFFSHAEENSATVSDSMSEQPGQIPDAALFSNRRFDIAETKPGTEAIQSSLTILLIDARNLAWADLTRARDEMLKFLRALPASQRVALYAMKGQGFQILEEGTVDHVLITSKLSQWMPSAQDLARAQEMEQHNRQQFDEVGKETDLQYVNGNNGSVPETANLVDPKLRANGSGSGRNAVALTILASIARHLAAVPGHKNLVWISSDNVLVDWTDQTVSTDKGSRQIHGSILRAQEELNDAHVSLYPLDASQLEAMTIDPSLENLNIQLAPGATGPPQPQSGGAQGGHAKAEMQQDLHSIQPAIQEMAEATGGLTFRRSTDIAAKLNGVVQDGRATYLLSFTPDAPADDQYHQLAVKLISRHGITLRYRTGYQYAAEPSTLRDRFSQAIWQPLDVNEIAVSAHPVATSTGTTLKLNIAITDLALKLQAERWVDKLDIFVVRRNDDGLHARITGQTLNLALKPVTYQSLLGEAIPFNQFVEKKQGIGSLRIVVVDENSGRMGSITLPATALQGKL